MKVHCGRMDQEEIRQFIRRGDFQAVVDATHPYAQVVTEQIRQAMEGMNLPYFRIKRALEEEKSHEEKSYEKKSHGKVRYFHSSEACARALEMTEGNVLLTTGSKELAVYCASEDVKKRLYVRVLPDLESLSACMGQGIKGRQVIAMQGPFTAEMNEAMIRQYGIACLVTRQSGTPGGYWEKRKAAEKAGIVAYVIGRPKEEAGCSFEEVCQRLGQLLGKDIQTQGKKLQEINKDRNHESRMQITLAGVGMGHKSGVTREVQDAIEEADFLLGAERMVEPYEPKVEKKPYYRAEQVIPYLRDVQESRLPGETRTAVVLFSGDSGFYSGCQPLLRALLEEVKIGGLRADVRILPGISSVAYLASCIGESYDDAAICSLHGKELHNLARRIKTRRKTYLLMSGVKDVNRLGKILIQGGLNHCQVVAGYQLSYPGQQIRRLSPEECRRLQEDGLYTCLVENPSPEPGRLTHGIPDGTFIRSQVPMTKEEVREVSICKLRLHPGAVVYDIGSGTGSVAVEVARLSHDIQVYAIEQKAEAVALIRQNKEKFKLENITETEDRAPEGLAGLPKATHAFIGGSGGSLKEILQALYEKNPSMRVVITAVTLETICQITEGLPLFPTKNQEMVQMQVSRSREAGSYHLMQAENPVWICAFDFCRQ